MSTHGSNALQPEGSGSTSYNNQNSPRGKKRESSEELVTLGAKKRRVEQQVQTARRLYTPSYSPPLQQRKQRKRQRITIDAVPAVDEQAEAVRRERQRQERDMRCRARAERKEELERERVRELEEEERRRQQQGREEEMATEFNRIFQNIRNFANSSLDTSTLSPQQRQMFEEMKAMTTDVFISQGSYTDEGIEGDTEMCSVCMELFEEDEGVSYFNGCSHLFHHECLAEWLARNDSCPNCRNPTANLQPRRQ